MKRSFNCTSAKSSVVTVGDGRGFVVNGPYNEPVVVTAAHCLPFFPPCHGASHFHERTYKSLLAPLGKEPFVWAECLFVDPFADIAVLGLPENQELRNEAEAYEKLVGSATPFSITDAPSQDQGWLLSLGARWFRCAVEYIKEIDGPLLISNPALTIVGGMSGSPVISDQGAAIGVICIGSDSGCDLPISVNPRLVRDLPSWLLARATRACVQFD